MKTRNAVIGLIGLAIIATTLFYIVKFISLLVTGVNTQTITTLLGITVPLVATVSTVYIGRSLENKKAQQEKIREFKVPIYNDFIERSIKLLLTKDIDEKERSDKLAIFFKDITQKNDDMGG